LERLNNQKGTLPEELTATTYLASFTASLKVYPVVGVIPYTLQCHITGIT
jgi:hypothetical protein